MFTHLVGRRATALNDTLTNSGFRRSQTIAYRPACESCRACVSVRVCVNEFQPNRGMRRALARNSDVQGMPIAPQPTPEQYALFRSYLDRRHADGGMADMTSVDYAMMVEDTHVRTRLIEYRRLTPTETQNEGEAALGPLIGVALTDVLADGLSMVYSFYDTSGERQSLGTFMILDHIRRAKLLGLPHVYLGYWVEGSRKMAYKALYKPQERLGMGGWERVEE